MSADIRKRKLLVISDTPVYKEQGCYVAFEPVVRELEVLSELFDEIVWLACKVKNKKQAMRMPAKDKGITIIPMPSVTRGRLNALTVLINYPVFLFCILRHIRSATHVHTRGPSHPAFIGLLFSLFDNVRFYWHKYAGNWVGTDLSFSYRMQRSLLRHPTKFRRYVTVNGKWADNTRHILAFENPCMSESERQQAQQVASAKDYTGELDLLFVGNITAAKGIRELMEAIALHSFPQRIRNVFIAGDGDLKTEIQNIAAQYNGYRIHVLGALDRVAINKLYERAHIIILPSRSEGFPKVIAEAAAYGCVPIVTNVSALAQYIDDGVNGYLLVDNTSGTIASVLNKITATSNLECIGKNATDLCIKFTYEHFIARIKNEIFH